MPDQEFSVIVLTDAGDFLLEEEEQVERQQKGIEIQQPYIFNEEEQAQEVQSERIFIPYGSIENIQYGDFQHETV
ncbi:MAG: hypothetical protein ABEI58_02940 [Candidatus Nanohaloarchaea archaeon]